MCVCVCGMTRRVCTNEIAGFLEEDFSATFVNI